MRIRFPEQHVRIILVVLLMTVVVSGLASSIDLPDGFFAVHPSRL
jgi:hypothetical protein